MTCKHRREILQKFFVKVELLLVNPLKQMRNKSRVKNVILAEQTTVSETYMSS